MNTVIMAILKKKILGGLIKRVGKGILDSVPIGATIKDNLKSKDGGEGKLDWVRLLTTFLFVASIFGLTIFYSKDMITFEQLNMLLENMEMLVDLLG